MKITPALLIVSLFLSSCATKRRDASGYYPQPDPERVEKDTSIHPLLELGGCYTFEINKDSLAGLVLIDIQREEENIFYGFLLSGNIFKVKPDSSMFRQAGIWGRKIPRENGDLQSFNQLSASEEDIRRLLHRFKKIDHIPVSAGIEIGSFSSLMLDNFSMNYQMIESSIKQVRDEPLLYGKYPDEVVSWNEIPLAKGSHDMPIPHALWQLTATTAHPKASKIMHEEWFWSPVDEFSPFGNDAGSDALYGFRTWRNKYLLVEPAAYIDELERTWGLSFSHRDIESEDKLPAIEKTNEFYRHVDQSIIGVAFAQFALEGRISDRLKELGIKAIHRQQTNYSMSTIPGEKYRAEYRARLQKMENILKQL